MTPIEKFASEALRAWDRESLNDTHMENLRKAFVQATVREQSESCRHIGYKATIGQLVARMRSICDGPEHCECGVSRDYNSGDLESPESCPEELKCDFITHFGRHLTKQVDMNLLGTFIDEFEAQYRRPSSTDEIVDAVCDEVGSYIRKEADKYSGSAAVALQRMSMELLGQWRMNFLFVREPFQFIMKPKKTHNTAIKNSSIDDLDIDLSDL